MFLVRPQIALTTHRELDILLETYSLPLSIIMKKLKIAGAEYNRREVIMYAAQYVFLPIEELKEIDGKEIKEAIEREIERRYKSCRPY